MISLIIAECFDDKAMGFELFSSRIKNIPLWKVTLPKDPAPAVPLGVLNNTMILFAMPCQLGRIAIESSSYATESKSLMAEILDVGSKKGRISFTSRAAKRTLDPATLFKSSLFSSKTIGLIHLVLYTGRVIFKRIYSATTQGECRDDSIAHRNIGSVMAPWRSSMSLI